MQLIQLNINKFPDKVEFTDSVFIPKQSKALEEEQKVLITETQ